MASFLGLMSLLWSTALAQQTQPDSALTTPRVIFTVVEKPPGFPGGMNKLGKYIKTNLRYPEAARKARREGRVFVTFIVNEQGGIEDVRALNKVDSELEAEAVRLVQDMPKWTPGQQAGRAVNCRYNLPISFVL